MEIAAKLHAVAGRTQWEAPSQGLVCTARGKERIGLHLQRHRFLTVNHARYKGDSAGSIKAPPSVELLLL